VEYQVLFYRNRFSITTRVKVKTDLPNNGGCSGVSGLSLQDDCPESSILSSSTKNVGADCNGTVDGFSVIGIKHSNTKWSSSAVFTRSLAGSSPVGCSKFMLLSC